MAYRFPVLSQKSKTNGATYTVYTYLTPILHDVLAVPDRYISLVFLLYGVVSVFSTFIGGKIAANNGIGKLRFVFLVQAVILASLYVSSRSLAGALVSISLIALLVYVMNSTMQLYFIDLADKHVPSARDLASSLTPVSVNVGIALGSALGGFVVTSKQLSDVSWTGGLVAVAAAVLTWISYRSDRKTQHSHQQKVSYSGEATK